MKINDIVRIKKYSVNSPNAEARIVDIRGDMVVVSNLNQPFQGTLSNVLFNNNEVEVIRGQ